MKAKIAAIWDYLHSSFWFLPSLMALFAAALALGMVAVDGSGKVRGVDFLYNGDVEGARSLLSAIANSTLSIAGVTFSTTIVALTFASGQFGPRLLRNFIRDRGNQFVLGVFLCTSVYSVLVLRSVRGGEKNAFVPHLSVTVAIALSISCVGALIYFIHHISHGIQVTHIIANVGNEFDEAVKRLFPGEIGRDLQERSGANASRAAEDVPNFDLDSHPIAAQSGGYVQNVDGEGLMKLAVKHDCVLHLPHRPGAMLIEGDALAQVWPAARFDAAMEKAVNAAFSMGVQRTNMQDALFPINQLTEIAVRALSPSTNDPFTAMTCLDRQGRALALLAQREMPSGLRYDDRGHLRIVAQALSFDEMADAAFDPIRQYASSNAGVSAHILDTLARVAPHLSRDDDRATLRRHADKTLQAAHSSLSVDFEIRTVEEHHAAALFALRV